MDLDSDAGVCTVCVELIRFAGYLQRCSSSTPQGLKNSAKALVLQRRFSISSDTHTKTKLVQSVVIGLESLVL